MHTLMRQCLLLSLSLLQQYTSQSTIPDSCLLTLRARVRDSKKVPALTQPGPWTVYWGQRVHNQMGALDKLAKQITIIVNYGSKSFIVDNSMALTILFIVYSSLALTISRAHCVREVKTYWKRRQDR